MTARFRFHSPEFQVEFSGSEEFVADQIGLVRDRIRAILAAEGAPAADASTAESGAPEPAPRPEPPAREECDLGAKTREGRGALQDSILIFAYYMQTYQGKHEFSIEDLNFCFDLLNIQRPKSLANTLGIIKRDRKLLHAGSRRGTYALSEKGIDRVRRLTG